MPDFQAIVRQRLGLPPMKHHHEEKIVEEVAGQLADIYGEALAAGMSPENALAHALEQVPDWEAFASDITGAQRPNLPFAQEDDLERVEVALRTRGAAWLADLGQDARFAVRTLLSRPGFSLTAVLVLALGIGAGTAIFSVVDSVLLRPLPYAEPDRLVLLLEKKLPQFPQFSVAPGNFLAWRERTRAFESLAAWRSEAFDLTDSGEPERLRGLRVTWNLFGLLGAPPVVGRDFRPDEDAVGSPPVVILSYELWQRAFAGDPSIVGRRITLDGTGHSVIGVAPASAQVVLRRAALFVPMAFTDRQRQQYGSHYLQAIGRLKRGVTIEQAEADMDSIARALEAEHPDDDRGWRVLAGPLGDLLTRGVRPALLMLLGAVGLLLLVACANVASLLLARGLGRQREFAIRAALGAGRARLVRQLLTESFVLALAAGATGLALAHWLLRGLLALVPANLPRAADVGLSAPAVACALGLSVVTPLLFGLIPALQAARTDLTESLAAGGRDGHVRQRARRVLVVTEMALATILLVGAGLVGRTFVHLVHVDPGFVAAQAVTADFALPENRYPTGPDSHRFYSALVERVSQAPGVRAAGASAGMPFVGDYATSVSFEGRPILPPSERPSVNHYSVSPGFFPALGIPLRRGRLLTEHDGPGAPAVTVVSETFVRLHFPGEDPLGKRVQVDMGREEWMEIVGIVGDTRQYGLRNDATAQLYQPYGQLPSGQMTLVVRTDGDPGSAVPVLREAVRAVDPAVPVAQVRALEDLLSEATARERFAMLLLGAFAALALLLAIVGLYGVLAYAVAMRRREIGVRVAHGARPRDVLWLFVREGVGLGLVGAAVGVAAALGLARLVASLLFGVEPTDPATIALTVVVLVAAAVLASLVPAHRAARTDVVGALRAE